MCVNTDGDMYDTWQRTAKLVAKLMIENSLDINKVQQHNTYSGKNCPQSLRTNNYWNKFLAMVQLEHIIMTEYADAQISIESSNKNLVDNTGRVIGMPINTVSVSYTLTAKIGTDTKSVVLSSVIPGTSTWNQMTGLIKIK